MPSDEIDAELLPLLGHEQTRVRQQVALALAAACASRPARLQQLLQRLFEAYKKFTLAPIDAKARLMNPEMEEEDREAAWWMRHGVALALAASPRTWIQRCSCPSSSPF